MWTDLSSVLSQCTRVTDRQTDGQTDRILIAIPRLHYMQRGNNYVFHVSIAVVLMKTYFSPPSGKPYSFDYAICSR